LALCSAIWSNRNASDESSDLARVLDKLKNEAELASDTLPEELARFGKLAVPKIVEALGDDERWVRYDAARALGLMKEDAAEAIPALMEALCDQSNMVRFAAGRALVQIGAQSVPAAMEGLGKPEQRMRFHSALVLLQFGPRAKIAISALIGALRDRNRSVRAAAADALGEMGPMAKSAIPALLQAGKDEAPNVRICAAEAKIKIDPNEFERGLVAARAGHDSAAIASFTQWLHTHPDDATCHLNLAQAYIRTKNDRAALAHFDVRLRLQPGDTRALFDRAQLCHQRLGDYAQALAGYKRIIELAPKHARAHDRIAWILATCPNPAIRNGKEAVAYAERACAIQKSADLIETLAAAHAETGNFEEAIRLQMEVLKNPRPFLPRNWQLVRARLNQYESRRPHREASSPWSVEE
jgi:tetratricopeptide (TPR) repeat protein